MGRSYVKNPAGLAKNRLFQQRGRRANRLMFNQLRRPPAGRVQGRPQTRFVFARIRVTIRNRVQSFTHLRLVLP